MSKQARVALEYHARNGHPKRGYQANVERLGFSTPSGKNFYGEIELLEEISSHTCTRCNSGYDPDIRWLRIAFFYEMSEIVPNLRRTEDGTYIAPFCKACRADFMVDVLKPWMEERVSRNEFGEVTPPTTTSILSN